MSFAGHNLACVRGERLVFENLDFSLPPGGALVVTGPNGSGKTSLLRLAAGLAAPAAGEFTWEGRPTADAPEAHKARIAFVGHLDAVKPTLTPVEDLRFWMRLRGGDSGASAAAAALERFAIENLAKVPARLLSAGQRRRLALARLAAPTRLWLLDEPTVTLDDLAIGALMSFVAEHRACGGAAMVATHQTLALDDALTLDLGGSPA